eukprot:scaffold269524_cov35-Tisochrysis_lutea.AAC.2
MDAKSRPIRMALACSPKGGHHVSISSMKSKLGISRPAAFVAVRDLSSACKKSCLRRCAPSPPPVSPAPNALPATPSFLICAGLHALMGSCMEPFLHCVSTSRRRKTPKPSVSYLEAGVSRAFMVPPP